MIVLLSPQSVAPPTRRVAARLPVGLREDSYSVGVHTGNLGRGQVALDGAPAVDLLCWENLKRRPCTCDDALAQGGRRACHLFAGACAKYVSGALGTGNGCHRGADCPWPHPENVLEELVAWRTRTQGPPAVTTLLAQIADSPPSRSALTASGSIPPRRCTVTASAVRERLTRHADDGATNVHRLLDAPWSDEALASDATRRLLSRRGCVKEICEAFAAADVVRTLAPAAAAGGSGLTILDVCSGSGLGAAVLSRVWPEARIVMLDSNREMDLTHVSERSNLDFIELDLFAKNAAAVLSDASAGAGTCVVLGVHLCGALSPRLITLCAHVEGVDAFGVSPCCIKGTLGEHVKRSAKELGRPNYDVILETLAEMADRELDGRGGVQLRRDDDMLSPRNGFVLGSKLRLSP